MREWLLGTAGIAALIFIIIFLSCLCTQAQTWLGNNKPGRAIVAFSAAIILFSAFASAILWGMDRFVNDTPLGFWGVGAGE